MDKKIVNLARKDKHMSWHSYFMSIALLSSFRSKDRVQNGACIVGEDKKIIGIGYNGMPRGIDDNIDKYWSDNDENMEYSRHTYVVHAEKNAIYNSITRDLKGSTLYVTQFPCNICAQALIQVGIKKVIYLTRKENNEAQILRNKCTADMFNQAEISFSQFDELNIKDNNFIAELLKLNLNFYG